MSIVGTEIDVTKPETTVSLTSSPTLTFSATPSAGKSFKVTLNADGTERTVTIPSSYSINRQGNITSVVVPANGTVVLLFRYASARWEVFGDPSYGFSLGGSLSNGQYVGIVEPGVAGTGMDFGRLIYYRSDQKWDLMSATGAFSGVFDSKLGVCVSTASGDGVATTALLYGKVRQDSILSPLAVGKPVFVSEITGGYVTGAPTTSKSMVRGVGWANASGELFFDPSTDPIVLQ
jgi:hypothetical protein